MKTRLKIKGTEIDLPDHMTALPQNAVDRIVSDGQSGRIIACGVFPTDSSLCFVTTEVEARIISPNARYIPRNAIPTIDGEEIEITFENVDGVHRIHHKLAYDASVSCLDLADLYVGDTYVSQFRLTKDDACD